MEASPEETLPGRCKDWRALLGPGVIVVDGWCTFPTAGWNMELRQAEPQGADPEELILERVVTRPPEKYAHAGASRGWRSTGRSRPRSSTGRSRSLPTGRRSR
jgi:hypothetical protein